MVRKGVAFDVDVEADHAGGFWGWGGGGCHLRGGEMEVRGAVRCYIHSELYYLLVVGWGSALPVGANPVRTLVSNLVTFVPAVIKHMRKLNISIAIDILMPPQQANFLQVPRSPMLPPLRQDRKQHQKHNTLQSKLPQSRQHYPPTHPTSSPLI